MLMSRHQFCTKPCEELNPNNYQLDLHQPAKSDSITWMMDVHSASIKSPLASLWYWLKQQNIFSSPLFLSFSFFNFLWLNKGVKSKQDNSISKSHPSHIRALYFLWFYLTFWTCIWYVCSHIQAAAVLLRLHILIHNTEIVPICISMYNKK